MEDTDLQFCAPSEADWFVEAICGREGETEDFSDYMKGKDRPVAKWLTPEGWKYLNGTVTPVPHRHN